MLGIALDQADFCLVPCVKGKQANLLAMSIKPDLVMLEMSMPDLDGNAIIAALREWSEIPILILSARASDADVVSALDTGADDYVTKPFSADVLRARINALLRSAAVREAGEPTLRNGLLTMDLVRHEVYLSDELVALTPKEYNLLRYLMIHRGKMLSHKDLLKEVWGDAHGDDTQYLRVFIRQIRDKIEHNASVPSVITNKPGVGYRMEVAEAVGSRNERTGRSPE